MALGRLVADVKLLNQELPSVNEKLLQIAETARTAAPSEAAFRASEAASRAAGEAARATKASNDSATAAANALASIPPVGDATFSVVADEAVTSLANSEGRKRSTGGGIVQAVGDFLRTSSSSGSGGAGGRGRFERPSARGGGNVPNLGPNGVINPGEGAAIIRALGQAPPTAGEKLIAAKLDSLTEGIRTATQSGGTNIRMGSKS